MTHWTLAEIEMMKWFHLFSLVLVEKKCGDTSQLCFSAKLAAA